MSLEEKGIVFDCEGESLVGVVSLPEEVRTDVGVLVIVGGPQYRAGSHRQFTMLCRQLAGQGIPCMRFDYRGMGDSTGAPQPFDQIDSDIRSALVAFSKHLPAVKRFVLWGLCDGASASSLYAQSDERVAGLVLLNPWVRTEATRAQTYLRHYYLTRLFEVGFWRKLLSGKLAVRESVGGALALRRAARNNDESNGANNTRLLPARMAGSLEQSAIPMLIVLSGKDYVAREFEQVAGTYASWSAILDRSSVVRLEEADHTFSQRVWQDHVATSTADWINRTIAVQAATV